MCSQMPEIFQPIHFTEFQGTKFENKNLPHEYQSAHNIDISLSTNLHHVMVPSFIMSMVSSTIYLSMISLLTYGWTFYFNLKNITLILTIKCVLISGSLL